MNPTLLDRRSLLVSMAAAITLPVLPALGQATYDARQEVVPNFGQYVPAHETSDQPTYATTLERVTTATPWGRGMAIVDGELIVLSRGRHRGEGGVSQDLVDSAGTLWRIDTSVCETVIPGALAGTGVRENAAVFARPTSPPFHLYDHEDDPANDRRMARPYCALAFDASSRNLFVCAYSGAELPTGFRKHGTDAVYRYDLRDEQWHVVEQHDPELIPDEAMGPVVSNAYYPHHDPATNAPPHGWVNGPDGCIAVGDFLYVPAKDNHVVVQYDLDGIRADAMAPAPASRVVLDTTMRMRHPGGETMIEVLGPSSVAVHDDFLYVGFRTSSIIVRIPLDERGDLVRDDDGVVAGDLIAVFEPWDAERKRSGNLYDIAMSDAGDLFVSMGKEGRVWHVTPDPARPFYGDDQSARPTTTAPLLDMSERLGKRSGSNNIMVDDAGGYLYVSNRNNDTGAGDLHGTIYRVKLPNR